MTCVELIPLFIYIALAHLPHSGIANCDGCLGVRNLDRYILVAIRQAGWFGEIGTPSHFEDVGCVTLCNFS